MAKIWKVGKKGLVMYFETSFVAVYGTYLPMKKKESHCTGDLLSIDLPYLRLNLMTCMHEPSQGLIL